MALTELKGGSVIGKKWTFVWDQMVVEIIR